MANHDAVCPATGNESAAQAFLPLKKATDHGPHFPANFQNVAFF
jgi:hypothetical protein